MTYRVAAVKYLNTKPFLEGLERTGMNGTFDLLLLPPAQCAELLMEDKVDIALCPVGVLPGIAEYHIITDYCIGCDGAVRTVAVYADKPLEELQSIQLDAHSRTSNLLVQVLLRKYLELPVEIRTPTAALRGPNDGLLSIGDRCFAMDKLYTYKYDLGEIWKACTGLPFVFACWVSKVPVSVGVAEKLNEAFRSGVDQIGTMSITSGPVPEDVARTYLAESIDYLFDESKHQALTQFLSDIRELKLVSN